MSKSFSRIPQETVNEITPTSIPWGGNKKTPTMEPLQKPKSPLKFAGGAAIAAGGLQSNFGLGNPTTQASAFEKLRGMGNQMSNTFASNRMARINSASPCALEGEDKRLSGSERKNVRDNINVKSPKVQALYKEYQKAGGKLSINQAARIGFATPEESRRRMKQANIPGSQGRDALEGV
jgi:hypothetical protein